MTTTTRASDTFREECDRIWTALHRHPFITELADGTLPLDKFRFFLEQDNFYLEEYGRCLAMGAAKSRTERELRYFTVDLNKLLDAEIPSNRQLLAQVIELGAADRGGSVTMAPANVAYTSYMQALSAPRRPARHHGGAPALFMELRRDRNPLSGNGRTPPTRSSGGGSRYFSSRTSSRWSPRCGAISTSS